MVSEMERRAMRDVSEGDRITEQNTAYAIAEHIAMPKARKKKPRISESLRNAAKAYKQAYIAVYNMRPSMTFDGTWIRLAGTREGISIRRLKELTTQLKNRANI
jgi:hypothetical protein